MRKPAFPVICMLVALTVGATAAQQREQPPGPSAQLKGTAISVVRLLNTAEYKFRNKNSRFGTVDELISSGALKEVRDTMHFGPETLDDKSPAHLLQGFSLQLNLSPEGDNYLLSLIEDNSQEHWGLFSDNKGLIYQGLPIR